MTTTAVINRPLDYRLLFFLSICLIMYLLLKPQEDRNYVMPMYASYDYNNGGNQPQRVHPVLRHQAVHAINPNGMPRQPLMPMPHVLPHPYFRPFRWTILPADFCTPDMKVMLLVHTAVTNKEKRAAIRETYGHKQWYDKYKIKTLFATGRSLNANDEKELEEEALAHKDIVQADFIDHYKNLTIKGLTWMRFLRDHCPDVQLIIKLDDDLLPNIFGFMDDFEHKLINTTRTFTCLMYYGNVIRDPGSPWFVPKEAMPDDSWGRYCTGTSFIMSRDLVPDIIAAVERRQQYVSVDDALFTGPIGREIGANYDFKTYASKYELDDKHTEEKMMARSVYFALYPTVAALRRMFGELQYIYHLVTDAPDHFKDYNKVS